MTFKYSSLFMAFALMMMLSSCGEKDYYDPTYEFKSQYAKYKQKFEEIYGIIAADKEWDLSNFVTPYRQTRATNDLEQISTSVPADAANQLMYISDGADNSQKGSTFTIVSEGEFVVCPVWHGNCTLYNLIISAYDPITGQTQTYTRTPEDIKNAMHYKSSVTYTKAIARNETVNGPRGWILPFSKGSIVTFNLQPCDKDFNPTGEDKSSALLLKETEPAFGHKHEYSQFILLDDSDADNDYNDLVIATYTKAASSEQKFIEPRYVTEAKEIEVDEISAEKRYMIEDLGTTDDFDFNDIVVDVKNCRRGTLYFTDGVLTKDEVQNVQTATIRHLGGILAFKLQIGDKVITDITPAIDVNPDKEYEITGWVPENNNIYVTIMASDGQSTIYPQYGFPKAGEAPLIIAKGTNTQWMKERESVPADWLK